MSGYLKQKIGEKNLYQGYQQQTSDSHQKKLNEEDLKKYKQKEQEYFRNRASVKDYEKELEIKQ